MAGTAAQLPDLRTLNHRLRVALGDAEALVLDRRPNAYVATFPAEIVTCRLADKQVVRLFCKHESGASDGSHGHRLGVAYEAEVYRQLLARAGVSTPRFYGVDRRNREPRPPCHRVPGRRPSGQRDPGLAAVPAAHRGVDREVPAARHTTATGAAAFAGQTARTRLLPRLVAARSGLRCPCRTPRRSAGADQGGVRTLTRPPDGGDLVPIHGEFYPRNVLVHEGDIRPIDWESTALAAGEIDLASLVERWPPDVVDACCAAYAHARWPAGPPSDSQSRLDMARIYLHFRWIAVRSTPRDSIQWRFEELRTIGARLGFLPEQ